MSRNINNAIEIVFDIIKLNFDLSSTSVLPEDFYNKRYVNGNANDARWLSHSKIIKHVAFNQAIKFAVLEFNAEFYFITIGLDDPDYLPTGIIEEKINAGLLTLIVSEFELPIKNSISNLYLVENILSQSVIDPFYKGHDKADLEKIFPNIYAMKITTGFGGDPKNIYQLIAFLITLNSKFIFLPFTNKTLDKIHELVACNSTILSYESITQALFSSHFKFAFLDLYRCIELLYQLIHLDEAYTKLSLSIDKTDFLIAIENDLGWRPKERSSLIKIFNYTPNPFKLDLNKAIKDSVPGISNYGNWLYDLRCNIVHLKSIQKKFELKDKDWEKIIYGISHMLCYWYNKYPDFN
ncbi:hypothetical protein [uncultured Flavobacterium sp.]|uniref:hypothetical protein n=1 Tax=uncultured Flavobacterium sp. TaxID=165435 RepID=UPI001207CDF8|nr:hypothetical protein [uncultured Flavobacterium sp.]THD30072.1 MAG: hypothetical protein DI588_17350 [Flavobacterium johnsoniae]